MIKTVKKYLVPHEGNDFKPHLLRESSVVTMFVLAFVLFCTSLGSEYLLRRTDLGAAVLPAVLVDLTNEHRIKNNQKPLKINPSLEKAALLKAKDMDANQYFAHTSPKGVTPWQWFIKAGYSFIYAGENLAINFDESPSVQEAWINSPGHHANLISSKFDETGIAVYRGTYQGHPTSFVVQLFGKRLQPRTANRLTAAVAGAQEETPETILLVDEPTFAVAQATGVDEWTGSVTDEKVTHYASFAERWLVNQSHYVQWAYLILMVIVYLTLIMMIVFEFRVQHPKNIALAVVLLVFLGILAFLNSTYVLSFF